MAYKKFPLLDNRALNTIPIESRKSIVHTDSFGSPFVPDSGFDGFIKSLPDALAAKGLQEFVQRVQQARKSGKTIIVGMGAHPIKVGLSPILIDLMEMGWISAVAVNGAFIIHDFEIAHSGKTSEDVSDSLHQGTFGTAEETGLFINNALKEGYRSDMGAGEAMGRYLSEAKFRNNHLSVLQNAYRLNIPLTVHPAIGTDIIHFHPSFNGEITGKLAERDFKLFASIVSKIGDGGIYINIGSAVIMPEIFLKAIAFCTALGIELNDFHTAVFDFKMQYRALENVQKRPVNKQGKGYYFVGHHELMIPLLAAMLKQGV